MKKVLLMINGSQPPFSEFAEMFKPLVEAAGQFEVEVSDDRNRLTGIPLRSMQLRYTSAAEKLHPKLSVG